MTLKFGVTLMYMKSQLVRCANEPGGEEFLSIAKSIGKSNISISKLLGWQTIEALDCCLKNRSLSFITVQSN